MKVTITFNYFPTVTSLGIILNLIYEILKMTKCKDVTFDYNGETIYKGE